ncbi:MAG TPA: heme-binding domain-containing protein [Methylomirabilota bacterium]|nr:heme-binding domain-containing protein [Methylomirabilota bacterium]
MRILRWLGITLVVALLAVQLVPYGRGHANPPARAEPRWDAPTTRALAVRACYDCHSNETVWPWYSHVAPVSWLAQRDVDEGRRKLNFSEWDRAQKEARESAKTVRKGEMPPWFYVLVHPDARLTGAETQALVAGLEATLGTKRAKGRDDD